MNASRGPMRGPRSTRDRQQRQIDRAWQLGYEAGRRVDEALGRELDGISRRERLLRDWLDEDPPEPQP